MFRYISTVVREPEIDLAPTHSELMEIEKRIETTRLKRNEFLKDLGLILLSEPGA